jgi:hypothetical protein
MARTIAREAEALTGALEAEVWASTLLGVFWDQRPTLALDESEDPALAYGRPLVETMAELGGLGARTALVAIAAVDDAQLGQLARELAERLPDEPGAPDWLGDVGEATITVAAAMREDVFDDGFHMFLEARHPDGETHAVGVYIDNNLGEMAMDVLVVDSIDRLAGMLNKRAHDDAELRLEEVKPAVAAAQIHAAMALTEMTLEPPVGEDYAALRALALLRAHESPEGPILAERWEMPVAERDALREEFLSSAEGSAFGPQSDEAFAVSLAIDFCADYTDGRPLRWSPAVVELFMVDWVLRKVIGADDLMPAIPAAVDAWVRFAGRKRGTPDWAIAETRAAIERCRDEMTTAASDSAGAGPTKQFLMAAEQAGVDLSDDAALSMFVAGWNARSTAP